MFSSHQKNVARDVKFVLCNNLKFLMSSTDRILDMIPLKISNAIKNVQTILKLFNYEALETALSNNPNINKIGAIIS